MIKRKQLNAKDKFTSFSLCFETKEFIESVEANTNVVVGKERKAWFKKPFPSIVDEIDEQLRAAFNIGNNRLIFSLYSPPEKNNGKYDKKETVIENSNENVMYRIIISTIQDQVELTLGKSGSEKMMLRPWEAYKTPDMLASVLTMTFENKRNMQIEAKKGFRTLQRSKKIDERYILVFDYLLSKNDLEELTKLITPGAT